MDGSFQNDKGGLIRAYTPADQPALLELMKRLVPNYFAPEEIADFQHYLNHERDDYFVLIVDDRVVACGGINYGVDGAGTARLSWDMVHPELQGRGLGQYLTNYRLSVCRQKQIQKVIVRTSQHAHVFYQKLGFTCREVHPDYWARGYDMYWMELNLEGERTWG